MILNAHQLPKSQYLFGENRRATSAFQGLRSSGPFDRGECPDEPTVLFVYPKQLKEEARKLYHSLRDGIGPFQGTDALLRYKLPAKRVKLLHDFDIPNNNDVEAAKRYAEAIQKWLTENDERPDIALILHPRTDKDNDENPYLSSKYPLLRAGIPSQVVTTDLISRNDLFQWSAATIALAMFAKMGGVPWAVTSPLSDDSIIVGINRAMVWGRGSNEATRYYGFASTFSHHGLYLGTKLFQPADSRVAYLQRLREALTESLSVWRDEAGGTPANLIVHVRKEISRDETEIVNDVMRAADPGLIRAYAILKLTESEHVLVSNPDQRDNLLPPPGVLIRTAAKRGILQITGVDAADRNMGKVVTHPIQVRLQDYSDGAPTFEDLCTHVLSLAAMNWRALNAEASPVSTKYPKLVAELLGRFAEAGFDLAELTDLPVMRRPWFL